MRRKLTEPALASRGEPLEFVSRWSRNRYSPGWTPQNAKFRKPRSRRCSNASRAAAWLSSPPAGRPCRPIAPRRSIVGTPVASNRSSVRRSVTRARIPSPSQERIQLVAAVAPVRAARHKWTMADESAHKRQRPAVARGHMRAMIQSTAQPLALRDWRLFSLQGVLSASTIVYQIRIPPPRSAVHFGCSSIPRQPIRVTRANWCSSVRRTFFQECQADAVHCVAAPQRLLLEISDRHRERGGQIKGPVMPASYLAMSRHARDSQASRPCRGRIPAAVIDR